MMRAKEVIFLSSDQDQSDSSRQLSQWYSLMTLASPGNTKSSVGTGELSWGQKHLAIEKRRENKVLEVPAK